MDDDELCSSIEEDATRQLLRERVQIVRPRRVMVSEESFTLLTPQFYEDILPSTALDRMFAWFQVPPDRGNVNASISTASEGTLGFSEFNRLRKCFHQDGITETRWMRALEELPEDQQINNKVTKHGFRWLFGPYPFFGGDNVVDAIHEILKYEETLHFSQMLVRRFGVGEYATSSSSESTQPISKCIGLEQLQNIQRESCVEVPICGDSEWTDVIQALGIEGTPPFLDWMLFTELFFTSVNGSTVFAPHFDPASVVHAVRAKEKVIAMMMDPDEDAISCSAFTSLLRSKCNISEINFEQQFPFLDGHKDIKPAMGIDMLKKMEITPSKLWEELEYVNGVFDMMRCADTNTLFLPEMNRLLTIIGWGGGSLDDEHWEKLCREFGASTTNGLTRRQFACCWYHLLDRNLHHIGDIFCHLDCAQRLFDNIVEIFEGDRTIEVISTRTLDLLAEIGLFPNSAKETILTKLRFRRSNGLDRDEFAQMMCGGRPEVTLSRTGTSLWLTIYFAKKLYSKFAGPTVMTKIQLMEMLAAVKVRTPTFTDEVWGDICDVIPCDLNDGLRLSDFLRAYDSGLLGARDAVQC